MNTNQPKASRGRRYHLMMYLLAPALLLAGLTFSGPAQAATPHAGATAAAGCRFTNGTSSNLRRGPRGPAPTGGTIFTFPRHTSCKDINISFVSATDQYEGWVLNSRTGVWHRCPRGFVLIRRGHQSAAHPPVLCTPPFASPGRMFAVVQQSTHQRRITVED